MVDLLSTEQSGESLVYRPISGLALAGFSLSALFAILVVITTLTALVQGAPIFLHDWALGIAVLAAVLCFLAQRRIGNAEGTLAGLALARWGLGLSVLLGVTYFVYTWVTGLALAKQADDFLRIKSNENTGFFPRLLNARNNRTDLYQAFLLSLPTTSRGGSKAENEERMLFQYDQPNKDGEPGNLTVFSKHPLVLFISKAPDTINIEPLGVVEWKYEGNCYHVLRNYRFTTPEWVMEGAIPAQSTEGTGEGEQRKWFVPMTRMPRFTSILPTPQGKKLLDLRYNSKGYLEKWRQDFAQGGTLPPYKESDTDWAKILPKSDPQRALVKKVLSEIFRKERKAPSQMYFSGDDRFADLTIRNGSVQVHHLLKMLIPGGGSGLPSYFNVEMDIEVATTDPGDRDDSLYQHFPWEITNIRLLRAVPTQIGGGPTLP